MTNDNGLSGRCDCGSLVYRLAAPPLFVHACHCLSCKRKSGSAFALTTIVLEEDIVVVSGALRSSNEDARRKDRVCAACDERIFRTSVKHPATALLNTGTLDDSRRLPIGAHIWVKRKHPWVILPAETPQFDEFYDREAAWPSESLERLRQATG
jgi:hypothetical protein